MTNAVTLQQSPPLRIMVTGYPGTAKTGMLASLLNVGFKLRVLDFDGNHDPLLQYTHPDKLKNLDIAYFEDKMRLGARFTEPTGIPTAFTDALKMMDDWKTTDENGTPVSLGHSSDWGPDTIVVLDSLTSMGEAAIHRAMKLMNKTPENNTDRVWGLAMNEQLAFIKRLRAPTNKHHVIVLAHLKIISPRDVRSGDSALTTSIKQDMAEVVPTRLYPSALGWQLPQQIGKEFPILLEAEKITKGGKTTRTLNLAPKTLLDVKFPGTEKLTETRLDIADGMLRVFETLSPDSVKLVRANEGVK